LAIKPTIIAIVNASEEVMNNHCLCFVITGRIFSSSNVGFNEMDIDMPCKKILECFIYQVLM